MREYLVAYAVTYDPMDDEAVGLVKVRAEFATDAVLAADQAAHHEAARGGRTIEVIRVREAVASDD